MSVEQLSKLMLSTSQRSTAACTAAQQIDPNQTQSACTSEGLLEQATSIAGHPRFFVKLQPSMETIPQKQHTWRGSGEAASKSATDPGDPDPSFCEKPPWGCNPTARFPVPSPSAAMQVAGVGSHHHTPAVRMFHTTTPSLWPLMMPKRMTFAQQHYIMDALRC